MTVRASAIPQVIDALLTGAAANLTGVLVLDGYGRTDDPGDYLMVGVDDPDSPNPANAADSAGSWPVMKASSRVRDEKGTVTCAAVSWNGAADQKAARDAVFVIVSGLATFIRTDPSLGLAPTIYTSGLGDSLQLIQDQGDGGASAIVIFTVSFGARI